MYIPNIALISNPNPANVKGISANLFTCTNPLLNNTPNVIRPNIRNKFVSSHIGVYIYFDPLSLFESDGDNIARAIPHSKDIRIPYTANNMTTNKNAAVIIPRNAPLIYS
jgi:hypothetical protein